MTMDEKTSYANDNSISSCWRTNSKAMVEFLLFLFGHVFGWLTDWGSRTIEKKKKMMMMMEKISAIQRKHATIMRPGQTRWEEMSMSMSMSIVKLISMKMMIKIKEN